jgi:hypothetical protein
MRFTSLRDCSVGDLKDWKTRVTLLTGAAITSRHNFPFVHWALAVSQRAERSERKADNFYLI